MDRGQPLGDGVFEAYLRSAVFLTISVDESKRFHPGLARVKSLHSSSTPVRTRLLVDAGGT